MCFLLKLADINTRFMLPTSLQAPLGPMESEQGIIQAYTTSSSSTCSYFNTLRPRQNDCYFPENIFKYNFLNENIWILIKISLKFISECPINNIPALIQIIAWHLPGDKPLSELIMVRLLMHMHHSASRSWLLICYAQIILKIQFNAVIMWSIFPSILIMDTTSPARANMFFSWIQTVTVCINQHNYMQYHVILDHVESLYIVHGYIFANHCSTLKLILLLNSFFMQTSTFYI